MNSLWWPAPLRSRFGTGSYPGNPIRMPPLPNRDRKGAGFFGGGRTPSNLPLRSL